LEVIESYLKQLIRRKWEAVFPRTESPTATLGVRFYKSKLVERVVSYRLCSVTSEPAFDDESSKTKLFPSINPNQVYDQPNSGGDRYPRRDTIRQSLGYGWNPIRA
jgi:hypothetical protein